MRDLRKGPLPAEGLSIDEAQAEIDRLQGRLDFGLSPQEHEVAANRIEQLRLESPLSASLASPSVERALSSTSFFDPERVAEQNMPVPSEYPDEEQFNIAYWKAMESSKPGWFECLFERLYGVHDTDAPPTFDENQGYVEAGTSEDF